MTNESSAKKAASGGEARAGPGGGVPNGMCQADVAGSQSLQLDKARGFQAVLSVAARAATAALAIAALALTAACGASIHVRYRITFTVEMPDGELRSASSIINTQFYGGSSSPGRPYRYNTYTTGVAPVMDLGLHGWLVAALDHRGDHASRKKAIGLECKFPAAAPKLLDAFGRDAADLIKLREGKRDLADGLWPPFIWFPKDKPYTAAEELCPEEFRRVIGADIELKKVTIEIVPNAPFKKALDISAPWLDEMRIDQRNGVSRGDALKPLIHYLEMPGVRR